ncbi:MAG: DMT family transporter [Bacteroidales bacterium]|nr:DMT family transporter [Bacteroidales bacterium]
MKENRKAILFACIAVLSWSTVATAFKKSLQYLSHFELVLVACVTSLIIFTLLMTFQKKWHLLKDLKAKEWGYFALLGLLNPVAYYLVLFKSYDLLPAQVAQPINYAWPIVLVVLLAVFTRQPIPPKKYIGMAVSLGGVALISLGGGQALGASLPISGLLLAASSAVLWASYWVVNNKNKERFDASLAFFMTFLFGSIYMTAGALFKGVDLNTVPGLLWGSYVGAFEMGIPFIFFGLAMRKTDNPALINQLTYLSPFMSLFFIAMILGEKIVPTTFIGLALIVIGIVFNEYFVKTKK